ncbi:hypothetical protein [Bordetella genomosp. 1]|uniref:hypothetical protein n=1 Tax=Bordetella genomosp. 1 TaxID=1395607 RepID=UPI0015955BF5|nr:hypothetical protein [Bordetella genomosp. 1]
MDSDANDMIYPDPADELLPPLTALDRACITGIAAVLVLALAFLSWIWCTGAGYA